MNRVGLLILELFRYSRLTGWSLCAAHRARLYGSDAMTSVVQVFTRNGSSETPELSFGADGGNVRDGAWLFVAGRRARTFRLQPVWRPVQHQRAGDQRRILQFLARREYWSRAE